MSCGVVAGVSMWPSVALKASQSTVAVHGADTVVGPANKQSRVLKKFILLLFGAFILINFLLFLINNSYGGVLSSCDCNKTFQVKSFLVDINN